tara:strand:- start:1201 stop:1485 length:285 start_codon:yes stop_codon:yes gene_type:complete
MILEIILGFICIIFFYVIINLTRKVEALEERVEFYEAFINNAGEQIEEASMKLKELDTRGSFEADDEIGFFFGYIKELQQSIANLIGQGETDNE